MATHNRPNVAATRVPSRWADDGATPAADPALTAVDHAFALLATNL
jgi:hypothetical protein